MEASGESIARGPSRTKARAAVQPSKGDVYQLKVTLSEVAPSVWRRLQVPDTITLARLHRVLQRVMGWTGAHLHEFLIGGQTYGEPDREEGPTKVLPERLVRLRDVATIEGTQFAYVYDFGDNWHHEVVVEKIRSAEKEKRYPVCLAGERQCPPEDCGGIAGYEEFLDAIRSADHPQHREMLEWVGGSFDPEAFDLDEVNRDVKVVVSTP